MNRDQFSISLSNLKKSDWERFEELSSSFLSVEFAGLRTMASPSGDGGRDSEIFNPNGVSHIAIQYSVTDNYEDKIKRTVKKFVIKDMKKRKKGSLQIQKKRLQLTPNKALKRRVA